jgi:hypothetical protein
MIGAFSLILLTDELYVIPSPLVSSLRIRDTFAAATLVTMHNCSIVPLPQSTPIGSLRRIGYSEKIYKTPQITESFDLAPGCLRK